MNRKFFFFFVSLLLCCVTLHAQKSELQQRAEAEDAKQSVAGARSLYIRAFSDYANQGKIRQGAECAARATALYYKENLYQEAFDLLRQVDQTIASSKVGQAEKAAARYMTTKERLQMYIKLRKNASAQDQLNTLEGHANQSGDEALKNDLLYNKAIFYYTFGQNAQGNAVFKEMANKLTAQKEYDKVDEVYQSLIANGRKSNSANIVAQSYSGYMAWKDSVSALKHADETAALKKQIAAGEETIASQESSLSTRWGIIIALCVVVLALAAALVVGTVVLLRFILLTRKQKKTIDLANESNALKAKFISNISAQLEPTLKKLDSRQPEVKALLDFSAHVQTLSELENSTYDASSVEEIQVLQFCESLMDQIRGKVKQEVALHINAPKMTATIHKEYTSHILLHLLNNAALYTPEEGSITLDCKKRGPHTYQFIVSDTGQGIAEEKRDDIFKPFMEVRDLTQGDGLGLPTCKQMALKMGGDLELDPQFTKGTRFVLELHS
jgi:signal transduction histidine kinase